MKDNLVKIEGYQIIQDSFFQEENKMYEGIFAQGNGYFHVRGSFEEGLTDAPQDEIYVRTMKSVTTELQRHPLSKQGTFLPLIMGKHPFLEEVIINLPFFMGIGIFADSEKLDMVHSNVQKYSRSLDMSTGELKRSFVWVTRSGCQIYIMFQRFASMENKHLFAQKFTCQVLEGECRLQILSGIDASVTTNGHMHFKETELGQKEQGLFCKVKTDLEDEVVMYGKHIFTGSHNNVELACDHEKCYQKYSDVLVKGQTLELEKYTAIGCSLDLKKDYETETWRTLEKASLKNYRELLCGNHEVWDEKWEPADIHIKGNDDLQNGLRFAIYHLLRCSNGIEERIQICAKGFAGEAYYGRYFWDSEMYLLPFYIYTNPRSARSMLMYRYHTLDGARENARRYHCRGARYPWQSALTGTEQCSMWEYADNEIHITADVAFGVMHYFKATDDWEFMAECGVEILLETARFWIDRVDYDEKGICHLINVMGPDEYSPMTKDNGFTNRMVKYNIESALFLLGELKEKNRQKHDFLLKKLFIEEQELEQLQKIEHDLPIPYDPNRNLFLQCADFEEYAHIQLDDYWKDKSKAFGHYVSQEKIYRTRCIKQADTIALMSMFEHEFSDEQVENAYDYYKPLTTHDSSLSPAVHTLAANRIGRETDVSEFVDKSLGVDLSVLKKGAEDGIHIANCGALWQMVVQGFAGVKPAYIDENIKTIPCLPSSIEEINMKIIWKNRLYQIMVNGKEVVLDEQRGGSRKENGN